MIEQHNKKIDERESGKGLRSTLLHQCVSSKSIFGSFRQGQITDAVVHSRDESYHSSEHSVLGHVRSIHISVPAEFSTTSIWPL
jgi:hypothetical protein